MTSRRIRYLIFILLLLLGLGSGCRTLIGDPQVSLLHKVLLLLIEVGEMMDCIIVIPHTPYLGISDSVSLKRGASSNSTIKYFTQRIWSWRIPSNISMLLVRVRMMVRRRRHSDFPEYCPICFISILVHDVSLVIYLCPWYIDGTEWGGVPE